MLELPCLLLSAPCLPRPPYESYTRAIRRLAGLLIIVTHFVEIVFVELSDEAGEIAVLEVLGEDVFGESLILAPISDTANRNQLDAIEPPAPQNFPRHPPIGRPTNTRDPPTFLERH